MQMMQIINFFILDILPNSEADPDIFLMMQQLKYMGSGVSDDFQSKGTWFYITTPKKKKIFEQTKTTKRH